MRDVEAVSIVGDADIQGVAYDSRKVRPGFLFVAMRGEVNDGNRFTEAAVRAGAVAIVSESKDATPHAGIALARVAQLRPDLRALEAGWHTHARHWRELAPISMADPQKS